MLKSFTTAINILAAGTILLGSAMAQQPATTPPPAAKNAPAAQSQQAAPPASNAALPTQKDKLSYAIGMNIGKGLHRDSIDVDPNLILRGLKDGIAGDKTLLTDEEAQATITQLQNEVRQKMEEQRKMAEGTNKKEGDAYLAANKSKEGVVTLPSGLQYKILKQGTGPKADGDGHGGLQLPWHAH